MRCHIHCDRPLKFVMEPKPNRMCGWLQHFPKALCCTIMFKLLWLMMCIVSWFCPAHHLYNAFYSLFPDCSCKIMCKHCYLEHQNMFHSMAPWRLSHTANGPSRKKTAATTGNSCFLAESNRPICVLWGRGCAIVGACYLLKACQTNQPTSGCSWFQGISGLVELSFCTSSAICMWCLTWNAGWMLWHNRVTFSITHCFYYCIVNRHTSTFFFSLYRNFRKFISCENVCL